MHKENHIVSNSSGQNVREDFGLSYVITASDAFLSLRISDAHGKKYSRLI